MTQYAESWQYTAAAEDAIENAVEMGYECVDCPSCDRGGPWLHKTETSVECPLCGAIITRAEAQP
jgi:ribosomal protein S27E